MVEIYHVFEAVASAITLLVALLVSYRAYRGYRITENLNLLILAAGFALVTLVFALETVGAIAGLRHTAGAGITFLFYYTVTMVEVFAYTLIMLAYLIKPKAENLLPIIALLFIPFTFQILIAILLGVIVFSVWNSYSRRPTAGTALVLSSFSLLFILHLVSALLVFSPRIETAGYLYYSIFQLLAFGLLYMAIGPKHYGTEHKERKSIE